MVHQDAMANADHNDARRDADAPAPGYFDSTASPRSLSPVSPSLDNKTIKVATSAPQRPAYGPRRQSSLAQPRANGEPRTPNRVRFHFEELRQANGRAGAQGETQWLQDQDPMNSDDEDEDSSRHMNGHGANAGQSLPLLTSIEAPSVTAALADDDFNAEDYLESARPRSGMKSAFMNMANSIIGAGIIGQPYALKQAGLLTGVLLVIGLTVVVDWTICLIVVNSKLSGTDSMQATMEHCFGKAGLISISIAQWVFAFGGMVAFCVIIGDTIPHVMTAIFPSLPDTPFLWLLADRQAIIILFIVGISFPLSLYRDIAKLAKASTLALISMVVIIVTVITQGVRVPAEMRGNLRGSLFVNSGIFQAIGVISFAFVCHHNSLLIYGSLRRPTIDRFSRVTHYSTFVSMVACLVMGLAGFLVFGDLTQGNVLNNFPTDNAVVNVARLCFGLNMLTTLPLECFVCRDVMLAYFYPGKPFDTRRHVVMTSALVAGSVAAALTTCDLGAVFEIIGATSACALAYIMPPLCYIRLSSRSWRTWVAWAVVVFGLVVMGISLTLAVLKIARGGGETHAC